MITLAIVKGTFFSDYVLFDLFPNNNKKKNNSNKVRCKVTLRVSKKESLIELLETILIVPCFQYTVTAVPTLTNPCFHFTGIV